MSDSPTSAPDASQEDMGNLKGASVALSKRRWSVAVRDVSLFTEGLFLGYLLSMEMTESKLQELNAQLTLQARELLKIADLMLGDRISLRGSGDTEEDHFGYMCSVYLSRQADHMRSMLTLEGNRDSCLIARPMLEGLAQIYWASREPRERALRWRRSAYIHDYRVLRNKRKQGTAVSDGIQIQILSMIEKIGSDFLVEKYKGKKMSPAELLECEDDPFVANWTGTTIKDQFSTIEGGYGALFYDVSYDYFCEYSHWGIGGFQNALALNGNEFSYSSSGSQEYASSIISGFICLCQTAKLWNLHFCRDHAESVRAVERRFFEMASQQLVTEERLV